MDFYKCDICGQIVKIIEKTQAPLVCCGQNMSEIKANTVDASLEKHVPVVKQEGNTVHVTVGSNLHPMTDKHYIQWIVLETDNICQRKVLKPTDEPKACFSICDGDKIKAVYAYCNIHGLWKA